MIKNSEEAIHKLDILKNQLKTIKYNHDLHKMVNNINILIKTLSMKEVFARQTKKNYVLDDSIKEVNDAIEYIEKLMIIAKLMD